MIWKEWCLILKKNWGCQVLELQSRTSNEKHGLTSSVWRRLISSWVLRSWEIVSVLSCRLNTVNLEILKVWRSSTSGKIRPRSIIINTLEAKWSKMSCYQAWKSSFGPEGSLMNTSRLYVETTSALWRRRRKKQTAKRTGIESKNKDFFFFFFFIISSFFVWYILSVKEMQKTRKKDDAEMLNVLLI